MTKYSNKASLSKEQLSLQRTHQRFLKRISETIAMIEKATHYQSYHWNIMVNRVPGMLFISSMSRR